MKVVLHHIAEKYLMRLNAADRNRIGDAIENLKKEPPKGDIRSYEGTPGIYRLKISGT
jgi:mRNA-degrading endonuclease RelE of RelBE toxin-antitoxin system